MVLLIVVVGSQEIQELPVKCNNVERGCNWKGTIGTLKQHIDKCEYSIVPCPSGCKDSSGKHRVVTLKELLNHVTTHCPLRKYSCKSCGKEGTFENITEEHDNTCKKKFVICSHCRSPMERGLLCKHVKMSCKMTEVACKFESIGCSVTMKRKDVGKHEENDDRAHLKLALDSIVALKEKLVTLRYGESIGFKVSGFSGLKKGNERFYSDPFYSIEGYKIRLAIDANGCGKGEGTHLSVSIELLDGKREDESERLVEGGVFISLLNQLSDSFHFRERFRFKNAQVGQVLGIPRFISHADLCSDSSGEVQFLLENTLYFQVTALSSHYKEWLDCGVKINTPLTRMIDDFRSLKQEPFVFKLSGYGTETKFASDPFNVSPCYSMAIVVFDNDTNPCLEVHCSVRRNHSITSLIWPFSGTIKWIC